MWIAVAVPAAIVVGLVVWWLRRDTVGVEAAGPFEVERKWGQELRLGPEAEAAFMEGLRAYNDAGNRLAVDGERAVLTTYDPPRLISLHLLADGFAARGDAALHDPQDTVTALLDRLAGAERPGVLHLGPGRLGGESGGIDPARFIEAVREVVCAGEAEGVVSRSVDESLGAVQVTVLGEPSVARDEHSPHVNGRQVPEAEGPATVADRTDETHRTNGTHLTDGTHWMDGAHRMDVTPTDGTHPTNGSHRPDGSHSTDGSHPTDGNHPTGGSHRLDGTHGTGGNHPTDGSHRTDGVPGRRVNTMMLDLARVLDRCEEARAERPDATPEALVREVAPRLIASGGPGLTWTRPPSQDDLRIVLSATGSRELH